MFPGKLVIYWSKRVSRRWHVTQRRPWTQKKIILKITCEHIPGIKIEAEIGVMQPQAKEHGSH